MTLKLLTEDHAMRLTGRDDIHCSQEYLDDELLQSS